MMLARVDLLPGIPMRTLNVFVDLRYQITLRVIAEEFDVSLGNVHSIVKNDLEVRKLGARIVPWFADEVLMRFLNRVVFSLICTLFVILLAIFVNLLDFPLQFYAKVFLKTLLRIESRAKLAHRKSAELIPLSCDFLTKKHFRYYEDTRKRFTQARVGGEWTRREISKR